MDEVFDVIIAGGGPGGSTCAAFLGKKGYKVLLLDRQKFPRDKTCGDAISGKSIGVLKELGLTHEVEAAPHGLVKGVLFSAPNKAVVQVPIPDQRVGYCCRREVYDNLLFKNAKKYAKTIEGFTILNVIQENGYVVGVEGIGEDKVRKQFRARMVVGADGATSTVATKLGLNKQLPEHDCVALRAYYQGVEGVGNNIELHFIDSILPGYFWIFPLENDICNIGVGMVRKDMSNQKINLEKAMLEAIENNPLFKDRFKNAKRVSDIKGWVLPFGSQRRKPCGNGFVLIGDAASLIDPFTGEGIGNAMTSGKLASIAIDEAFKAKDFSDAFFTAHYETPLRNTLDHELQTSYKMQKLGKHKFLLNLLVGKASRSKEVRDAISATLVSEEAKKNYFSPMFYLKLLFA